MHRLLGLVVNLLLVIETRTSIVLKDIKALLTTKGFTWLSLESNVIKAYWHHYPSISKLFCWQRGGLSVSTLGWVYVLGILPLDEGQMPIKRDLINYETHIHIYRNFFYLVFGKPPSSFVLHSYQRILHLQIRTFHLSKVFECL